MKKRNQRFWIGLSLVNLFLVALFGFLLRSKILFPLSFVDYPKFLSAHAYFALTGWLGLSLSTLLIAHVLPEECSGKSFYQWMLAGIETGSVGIALSFSFQGYSPLSAIFSSLYVIVSCVFAAVFINDALRNIKSEAVKILAVSAAVSLLLSVVGPLILLYMNTTGSHNAILHRDAVYTLLHFQYNGFFTLGVFAVLFTHLQNTGFALHKTAERFAKLLSLSVVPALPLSFLWHGGILYYAVAVIGVTLLILASTQLLFFCKVVSKQPLFQSPLANGFLLLSTLSFLLKIILNTGALIPPLGNAVYGDRPAIIGFLHLVFLGFVTFFILAYLLEENHFPVTKKNFNLPFLLFATGIVANEIFLMLQGLTILFNTYSNIYNRLLWMGSFLLAIGAAAIAVLFWRNYKSSQPASPYGSVEDHRFQIEKN